MQRALFAKIAPLLPAPIRTALTPYADRLFPRPLPPPKKQKRKPVVFSFVSNPCTNDSRVLKQAATLSENGYHVRIYCTPSPTTPDYEVVDGIEFVRIPFFSHVTRHAESSRLQALESFGPDETMIERHLRDHAQSEATRDNLHDLFFSQKIRKHPARFDTREKFKAQAVSEREIRRERFNFLKYYWFALNMASLKWENIAPDFIHAHDLYTVPGALIISKRTGAKVVYDAHEIETERVPPRPPHEKAFIDRLERRCMSQVERMIVVSDSIAEFYEPRLGSKPTVVLNSPDMKHAAKPTSFSVREAAGVKPETPLVVYTGRVGMGARGLDKVVEALSLLPDYHLAILGPRIKAEDDKLLATAPHLSSRIHLLPPVKPQGVPGAIKSADVGVCPIQDETLSYRYSMPNKLFEMALSGLPMAVSNLPEMSKFVRENRCGVIMDQTDPNSIAAAIRQAYEGRDEMRLNDQELASIIERYGWSAQADTLLSLYRDMRAVSN